jgi:hypothetical protein
MNILKFTYNGVERTALALRPSSREAVLHWQLSPKPGFKSFKASTMLGLETLPISDLTYEDYRRMPDRLKADFTIEAPVVEEQSGSTYDYYVVDDPYVNDFEGVR